MRRVRDGVVEGLETLIADMRLRSESRLPPMRALARTFDVSVMTVSKALSELRERNVVYSRQGKGIFIRGATPEEKRGDAAGVSKHEALVRSIYADIIVGHFDTGGFPLIKELQHRYGVSYSSVKKVLVRLEEEGVLLRRGKKYAPGVAGALITAIKTIVVFIRAYRSGEIHFGTTQVKRTYKNLERRCAGMGIKLTVVKMPPVEGHGVLPMGWEQYLSPSIHSMTIMGYVVWTQGLGEETQRRLLRRLQGLNRSVAVIDESTWLEGNRTLVRGPYGKVFSMANSVEDGVHLGQYALSRGHRHVSYFHVLPLRQWSRRRLEGLRKAFALFGDECRVDAVAYAKPERWGRLDTPFDRSLRQILQLPANRADMHWLRNRSLERLKADARLFLMADEIQDSFNSQLDTRKLLSGPQTLWIGENDGMAVFCETYLRVRGRHIPRDVSLLCFEDSDYMTEKEISAYDFNATGYTGAILEHILAPLRFGRLHASQHPGYVPGYVVERGTVADVNGTG